MSSSKRQFETELLSVVAHDLKSPIGAVRGFLDLIDAFGELNDKQAEYLERSMLALDRMEGLISTMLRFAELDAAAELNITDVDLREVADETVMMLTETAAHREITISVSSTAGKSSVPADGDLMRQVVQNLLANAIKYNVDGGEVTIKITKQGPVMRVDVIDSGIGIDPTHLPKVFDQFYRVKQNPNGPKHGTGLGLAIAKMIISMHDGDIWVDSTLGEGSAFSFTLPMHRSDATGTSREPRRFALFPSEQASEASDAVDDSGQEAHDSTSDIDSREENPDGY